MSTISAGTTLTTALVQTGDTTGDLVIKTDNGNTTAVTINTAGAIGVGSSPSYGSAGQYLQSAGNAAPATWATVPSTTPGGSNTYVQYNNAGAFGGSSSFVFDGTNVGIGTSSPVAKLEVSSSSAGVTAGDLVVDTANKVVYVGRLSSTGSDNAKLVVRNRVGDALTITGDTSPDGTGLFRPGTNLLGFTSNGSEKMRITSNGGIAFSGASNYGSSGQLLQSNGDAAPTWVTAALLGSGQTWTDVGGSRSSGTTYTNSTGKPIQIMVCTDNTGNTTYGAAGAAKFYINGSNVGQSFCSNAANIGGLFQAVIPNGSTYSVSASTIRTWWELR